MLRVTKIQTVISLGRPRITRPLRAQCASTRRRRRRRRRRHRRPRHRRRRRYRRRAFFPFRVQRHRSR
jgi:hypothetical protein